MSIFSNYAANILTIKDFPLIFNDDDRREFLEHFGAIRVRCLKRYKNLTNLIIADFGTHIHASQALRRLHQLDLLTRRLVVEYCSLELIDYAFSSSTSDEDNNDFLHGISPGQNQIYYSLPTERLSYVYPPADETILANINNALLSIPAFYTQVLHLMNKMSLPCPMIADSTKKLHRTVMTIDVECQTDESTFLEVINMDTDDDDESEIDDGEEEERVKRRYRSMIRTTVHQGILPSIQTDTNTNVQKKKKPTIDLKIPQTFDRYQDESVLKDTTTIQGFGRIGPLQSTITIVDTTIRPEKEELPPLPLISLEQLEKNRLNEEQLRLIDNGRLYRNYDRGQPSQRLYIKNLDVKHVDERTLHSIYDRYKQNSFQIDIRLMHEGKMKGQAFVTMPNEDLALQALNDTNGFILYEKPMIVQFARSAKPKDLV